MAWYICVILQCRKEDEIRTEEWKSHFKLGGLPSRLFNIENERPEDLLSMPTCF